MVETNQIGIVEGHRIGEPLRERFDRRPIGFRLQWRDDVEGPCRQRS